MPIFEYKCNICEEEFEKLVLIKESENLCPKCGSKEVRKRFSVFRMRGNRGTVNGVGNRASSCSGCSSSSCSSCH